MNIYVRQIAIFFVYLILQVLVFNQFTLFNVATPFVFLLFLLMLPMNIRLPVLMVIAFFAGLMVDLFSFNAFKGLNAAACVLMMSIRTPWVNVFTNRFSYHGAEEYLLQVQTTPWYAQYLFPLILLHHLAYFFLEAFSFDNVGLILIKVFTSAIYTFGICLLFTLLFHKGKKR